MSSIVSERKYAGSWPTLNTRAFSWTLGVHALLLLLFFWIRYSLPAVEHRSEELGMEINLGTSDKGSGQDQPMYREDPAAQAPAQVRPERGGGLSGAAPIFTHDDPEAPSLPLNPEGRAEDRPQTTMPSGQRPDQGLSQGQTSAQAERPRYVYSGAAGTGGNQAGREQEGRGEGQGTEPGDQGVPDGTPGAETYSGLPGGGGVGHNLNRRTIVAFPPREARYAESGTVTIRVTVNREGDIVHFRVLESSHAELSRIAVEKLRYIRFNKSSQAPQEQFGNIRFRFTTRS